MSNRNIKRITALVICVILAVSILPLGTFACGPKENNGNGRSLQYQKLCVTVDAANMTILALVRYAQLTPYNDVAWLLRQVDSIVNSIMKQASKIGANVICEYEYYYIDGELVAIDPIRVIN